MDSPFLFHRIAIVGIGLIGGSLARSLRQSGEVGEVVGIEPHSAILARARERGLIDRGTSDPALGVRGADLVVIAVPVGSFAQALESVLDGLEDGTVVTDVGSVKGAVQDQAEAILGAGQAFVGGHPIAGTEDSGVEAATEGLFRDALCVLTPTETTPHWALTRVRGLWERLGARIAVMDPQGHDQSLAVTSHLPHMLAFALVQTLADRLGRGGMERFAASGFRDLTRIAGSDAIMWRDIALTNRTALLATIDRFQVQLAELRGAIERGDGETLEALFREARALRRGLSASSSLNGEQDGQAG